MASIRSKQPSDCIIGRHPTATCFAKDICKEYLKLAKRLQKLQPRPHQRRTRNLARPKYVTPKKLPATSSNSNYSRKADIIRELPSLTRTEQLAYPRVRKILPIREDFKDVLGAGRVQVLSRTMRKSLFSLYSRLANCQPPEEKMIIEKWTKKEWAVHRRYLSKLAQPKKIFKPLKAVHMWKDISIMDRFKYLCKPKDRSEHIVPKWELTSGLKKYKPTPIIINLSKPKETNENLFHQTLPIKINPGALQYKATDRILQLATRAEKRTGESILKENPFSVAPNALKAKPSDRVVELSQPKEYEEGHVRQNPFMISPAALKAKPTTRIIELSQPKGSS
ncbi:uncharacterized protein LOC129914637 [Episyrphus balteatus]|uniref:uncharacterized protein LOC129914637 n=1 Tax=Episyrphus balteatus TaxID=286459 RepID=UPI002485A0AD|nr:uncharacterized protein LOC129914637 [Episyrphus balteatus]